MLEIQRYLRGERMAHWLFPAEFIRRAVVDCYGFRNPEPHNLLTGDGRQLDESEVSGEKDIVMVLSTNGDQEPIVSFKTKTGGIKISDRVLSFPVGLLTAPLEYMRTMRRTTEHQREDLENMIFCPGEEEP